MHALAAIENGMMIAVIRTYTLYRARTCRLGELNHGVIEASSTSSEATY
jgi:hypothetical protein